MADRNVPFQRLNVHTIGKQPWSRYSTAQVKGGRHKVCVSLYNLNFDRLFNFSYTNSPKEFMSSQIELSKRESGMC